MAARIDTMHQYVEGTVAAVQQALREHLEALQSPTAPIVQAVGARVWEFVGGQLARRVDDLLAERWARVSGQAEDLRGKLAAIDQSVSAPFLAARQAEVPVIKFTQFKKWVQHPPTALPSGDIALLHNASPEETGSSEVMIPDTGYREVKFGYGVSIPGGWLADVTVRGVTGERVYVATLAGETPQNQHGGLRLLLRTTHRYLVQGGQELARLHLRRCERARVQFVDFNGREGVHSGE